MNRKNLLYTSSALLVGQALSSTKLEAQERSLEMIDTHQHLWDLDIFELPWNKKGSGGPLARNFVTSDYLEATRGFNIVQVLYMEVNVAPHQKMKEALHVLELCRSSDHPTTAAVISGPVESADFRPYIKKLSQHPEIKGVRRVLHGKVAKGTCLQPQFVKNMQLLGELNLNFDLCMRPDDLEDALKLVEQCPETRFVIDHCGNVHPGSYANHSRSSIDQRRAWQRDMMMLAEHPQVYCKISGMVHKMESGKWSADDLAAPINFCMDTFGPDRVVFGSDWPVCNLGSAYREWVEALKQVVKDRPLEDQKKLFSENAIKCYRLS
jgi:predicted TIM-barrel fold metal-dependent hydrolase